jgi:hypothetical protein
LSYDQSSARLLDRLASNNNPLKMVKKKSKKSKADHVGDDDNGAALEKAASLSSSNASTTGDTGGGGASMPRATSSQRRRKKKKAGGVRFADVQVREFRRRHGGSSTVPEGMAAATCDIGTHTLARSLRSSLIVSPLILVEGYIPLGLSWRHEDMKPKNLDE